MTSKPSQIAHLAQALDARPEWLQGRATSSRPRTATTARSSARRSPAFHAAPGGPRRRELPRPARPKRACCWSTTPSWASGPTARPTRRRSRSHNGVLASAQRLVASAAAAARAGRSRRRPRRRPPRAARSGARSSARPSRPSWRSATSSSRPCWARTAPRPSRGGARRSSTEAASEPSQSDAAHRARHRLAAGRRATARVAVFCESTTQLKILQRLPVAARAWASSSLFDGRARAPSARATWSGTSWRAPRACSCSRARAASASRCAPAARCCCPSARCRGTPRRSTRPSGACTASGRQGRRDHPVRGAALGHVRQAAPARRQARPARAGGRRRGLLAALSTATARGGRRAHPERVRAARRAGNYQVAAGAARQAARVPARRRGVRRERDGAAGARHPTCPSRPCWPTGVVLPDVSFAQSEFVDVAADCVADSDDE